jgi:hypothetical protein
LPGRKFAYLFDSNALLSLRGYDVEYQEFLPDAMSLNIKSLTKGKGDSSTVAHPSTMYHEWQQDFDKKLSNGFFEQFDVIGMDSATTFLDMTMDRVLTINGRPGQWPQQDDYGPQMIAFTNVVRTLVGMGKTIYMTGHLELRQDDLSKKIYRSPVMTGRLKLKIPLLFSDIFVAEAATDNKGGMSYRLQTMPDRTTTTVRTSIKGLAPYEDVTLDFSKELEKQGLGKILTAERQSVK